MLANFAPSSDDLLRFSPELILSAAGTLLMVLDPFFAKRSPRIFGHISIISFIVAIFVRLRFDRLAGNVSLTVAPLAAIELLAPLLTTTV